MIQSVIFWTMVYDNQKLRDALLRQSLHNKEKITPNTGPRVEPPSPSSPSLPSESLVEPQAEWPSSLGFCTTGGWPSEVILTAEDAPVQVIVYEMEKVKNEDKIAVLIAAVSDEEDISTKGLLRKVQDYLRCDLSSWRHNTEWSP